MSPARGDARRRDGGRRPAASSTSPRSPRASPSCRSTARPRPRPRRWSSARGLDWAIVRPPAVYGPGDRETLELFRMAKRGLVLLPPEGRLSLIHVDDLARLLLALAAARARRAADRARRRPRRAAGPTASSAQALGRAVGRRGDHLSPRAPLLQLAARADRLRARRQGQADARPRRLFLPPRLGRDRGPLAAAGAVAAADRDRRASLRPPPGTGRKAGYRAADARLFDLVTSASSGTSSV